MVVAPDAGDDDPGPLREVVATLASAAPTEVRTVNDEASTRQALADLGGRRLVIAGGDGTVHHVLNVAIADGSRPVAAVCPTGTANDLARNLGIPLDPGSAARVAVSGRQRPMPVGRLSSGGVVVNHLHAGLGPEASRRAERMRGVLGRLRYPLAVAGVALVPAPHLAVGVTVDGREVIVHDGPLLWVQVQVAGPSIGGGIRPTPAAAAPTLRVLVLPGASGGGRSAPVERVRAAVALLRGAGGRRPGATRVDTERVHLTAPRDDRGTLPTGMEVVVDGELVSVENPLAVTLVRDAWVALVP